MVHRSRVDRLDRCQVGSVPSVTPARALVDCAGILTFEAVCDMVDTALYRQLTSVRKVVAKGDFVWPGPMVYDGEEHHGPRQWTIDDGREGNVVALGWTVVRADRFDFPPSATRLADVLRATLTGL